MQKQLAGSLSFTLDKIKIADGRDTVDDLIKILHLEDISRALFKRLVKSSRASEVLTEEFNNKNKDI